MEDSMRKTVIVALTVAMLLIVVGVAISEGQRDHRRVTYAVDYVMLQTDGSEDAEAAARVINEELLAQSCSLQVETVWLADGRQVPVVRIVKSKALPVDP